MRECGWGARVRESVWMGSKSKRECVDGEQERDRNGTNFTGGYLPFFFDIVPVHLEKSFPGLLSKNGALTRAS